MGMGESFSHPAIGGVTRTSFVKAKLSVFRELDFRADATFNNITKGKGWSVQPKVRKHITYF